MWWEAPKSINYSYVGSVVIFTFTMFKSSISTVSSIIALVGDGTSVTRLIKIDDFLLTRLIIFCQVSQYQDLLMLYLCYSLYNVVYQLGLCSGASKYFGSTQKLQSPSQGPFTSCLRDVRPSTTMTVGWQFTGSAFTLEIRK